MAPAHGDLTLEGHQAQCLLRNAGLDDTDAACLAALYPLPAVQEAVRRLAGLPQPPGNPGGWLRRELERRAGRPLGLALTGRQRAGR